MGLRSKVFRYAMTGGFSRSASVTRSGSVGVIGRSLTKSIRRLSSRDILRASGNNQRFDSGIWEELYTEIIEAQRDKAGNAGQETLLSDDYFGNDAKQYCSNIQEDYTPEGFVNSLQNSLGDDYYNAINIIIDECAEELVEAWDRAFSNDGVGEKLFGLDGYFGGGGRVYGSFSNALNVYTAAATKRGYDFSGSAAGNARNRELNKQSLIAWRKNNPNGTARTYAPASYINAARKNGKNL